MLLLNVMTDNVVQIGYDEAMIDAQFGAWTVRALAPSRYGKRFVEVECACGARRVVQVAPLLDGRSTSCGCGKRAEALARRVELGPPPPTVRGARWLPVNGDGYHLVDATDFPALAQFAWTANGDGYAVRRRSVEEQQDGGPKSVLLHRQIMRAPEGVEVDHRDRNRHDSRRKNLRFATRSQNAANGRDRPSRTGFRGVRPAHRGKTWDAQISVNGKKITRQGFATPEAAARAYNALAREHHGQFARLNRGV